MMIRNDSYLDALFPRQINPDHLLLYSDCFSLAATSAGSIIIIPREISFHTFAKIPASLLDEVIFLQGLIGEFFQEMQGCDTLYLEYGEKQQSPAQINCYPQQTSSMTIWQQVDLQALSNGIFDLTSVAANEPYLFIQILARDQKEYFRTAWISKINDSEAFQEQLSRAVKLPETRLVGLELKTQFEKWLRSTSKVDFKSADLEMDYLRSVEKSNQVGYDSLALAYQNTWAEDIYQNAVERFLSALSQQHTIPLKVLDVGCGPGQYLNYFWQHGLECVGIDASASMVETARQRFQTIPAGKEYASTPAPTVKQMSLFDLTLEPRTFDAIWYSAVVVHTPRRSLRTVFTRLHKILRDDGLLYVSARLGHGSTIRPEGRVFFFYRLEELEIYLEQAGFKIITRWTEGMDRGTTGQGIEKRWGYYLLRKQ